MKRRIFLKRLVSLWAIILSPLAGLLFPGSSRSLLDGNGRPATPLRYYNDTIWIDQRRKPGRPSPGGPFEPLVIGMDEKMFQHVCSSKIYGPPGKIIFDDKNFGVLTFGGVRKKS
jgi:hypothetical protein